MHKAIGTQAILVLKSSRACFEGDSAMVRELAQKKEGIWSHQGDT